MSLVDRLEQIQILFSSFLHDSQQVHHLDLWVLLLILVWIGVLWTRNGGLVHFVLFEIIVEQIGSTQAFSVVSHRIGHQFNDGVSSVFALFIMQSQIEHLAAPLLDEVFHVNGFITV